MTVKEWKWVQDFAWTTDPEVIEGKRCRWGAGYKQKACGRPAVAAMRRNLHVEGEGNVGAWWCYCEEHLYGRRIAGDGTVLVQRLIERPWRRR